MSMKTVFSFNRSWYFFRRSLFFNIRSILLSSMLVYVILVILFMLLSTIVYPSTLWHNPEFYFMTEDKIRFVGLFLYGIGLFVFLCISPWCFGFLPSDAIKSRLTIELMIPASSLEQYVVRWLFCIFGGSLLYHVAFVAADITRCWVLGWLYPGLEGFRFCDFWTLYSPSTEFPRKLFLGGLCYFQSFYFFCGCFWRRHAYIKASLLLFLMATGVFWVTYEISQFTERLAYSEEVNLIDWYSYFAYFLALIHWILGYYRLKESENITRW